MTGEGYDAAGITVLAMDEAVLRRPGMYFRVGLRDPRLAGEVLCAVVGHSLHPPTAVAAPHSLRVEAEIHADLEFSVTDDRADALDAEGLGYHDSLLGPHRFFAAAAAVLSAETLVEVWRDGQGLRQRLERLRPVTAPAEFAPPPGEGTRVRFRLAPEYFGAPLPTDLASLTLHGETCAPAPGTDPVLRDLR